MRLFCDLYHVSVSSLTPLPQLLYLSPQTQESLPKNPQVTTAKEAGRLMEIFFSFPSAPLIQSSMSSPALQATHFNILRPQLSHNNLNRNKTTHIPKMFHFCFGLVFISACLFFNVVLDPWDRISG